MSTLTRSIYRILSGDPRLTGLLSCYQGEPGIFTGQKVPGGADMPCILIGPSVSDLPFDTKNSRGRRVFKDIYCYTSDTYSHKALEEIAERVRELFHRKQLEISGQRHIITKALGPAHYHEDEQSSSLIVSLEILTEENNGN